MTSHHTWTSLDTNIYLHINSGERSFKLRNLQDVLHPEDSHVTCHDIVWAERGGRVKVVTYVKSGCDSGFMCAVFSRETDNVMRVQFGQKARIPGATRSHLSPAPLGPVSSVIKPGLAAPDLGLWLGLDDPGGQVRRRGEPDQDRVRVSRSLDWA